VCKQFDDLDTASLALIVMATRSFSFAIAGYEKSVVIMTRPAPTAVRIPHFGRTVV
jgi:hypothetical protein